MSTAEPDLTPRLMLGQILRAALKMAKDAVSVRFASRQAVSFTIAGQAISGYFYYAKSETRAPGVLLLSTAAGLTPHEHALAARLARVGFTTLVIRYTRRTSGRAVMKNEARRKQLEQIVLGGWRALRNNDRVDDARTAVLGLSLGGYFAAYLATAIKDFAPRAVVIYYGMYATAGSALMQTTVPLLLLQGESDDQDFISNAQRVSEIAARDGKPWQVSFYPATGHQFDLFDPRGASARDAWERTLRFLREQLRATGREPGESTNSTAQATG